MSSKKKHKSDNKKSKKEKNRIDILAKKAKKKFKKIENVVEKQFSSRNGVGISKNMIHSIVKGVNLNKTLIERDKEQLKKWQEDYYQQLFSEFKILIERYNQIYKTKIEDLESDIKGKERYVEILDAKIEKKKKQLNGKDILYD